MPIQQDDKTTVILWPAGAPGALGKTAEDQPSLTLYPPDPTIATGGAIVVVPGGGYGGHADHEGRPVAEWLNSLGIFAAVLQYRLGPKYHHSAMLNDASRAIRFLRSMASDWKINPNHVGILGFSAGGHLASTASVHFDDGENAASDPVERLSSRPDVSVLIYPVIDLSGKSTHVGSRNNLLGENAPSELVEFLSTQKQVTATTPPAFLVSGVDDVVVPVENSLSYALALSNAGVPYELHAYQNGPHGFGLGGNDPILSSWPIAAAAWLKKYGF